MSTTKHAPTGPSHAHADGLDESHAAASARAERSQAHLNTHTASAQRVPLPTLDALVDTVQQAWLNPGEDWGHAQLEAIKHRSRQWRDQGVQARLSAEAYVKAQPFTALAWAAAVGAALVAVPLWWRRR